MRRRTIAALATSLVAAVLSTMPPASGGAPRGREVKVMKAGGLRIPTSGFVPGELVVSFRPGLEPVEARAVHSALGSTVIEKVDRGPRTDLVQLPPGASVLEAARSYGRRAQVSVAEPNWYLHPAAVPDDTSFASQWGLDNTAQAHPISDPPPATSVGTNDADIDAPEAWDTEMGDPSTVIAVIDSGVDVAHPDLAGNVWTNPGEIPGNDEDDDGNGYTDDIHGWDTAQDDNTLLDSPAALGYDHGTHVAGIIAAVTENATGVAGTCGGDGTANSGCTIMVLKFMFPFNPPGPGGLEMVGTLADELEAIAYARDMDADIINASFGGAAWSPAERNAFKGAGSQSGILSIVAAGNESLNNDMAIFLTNGAQSPSYPASYNIPQIMSVAASNDEDRYAYDTGCHENDGFSRPQCAFSSFGRHSVDIAAPGVDILSTVPTAGPDYATFNGTSMAAPHVAGVAGLLESADSSLGPVDIKDMIMNSADRAGLPLNTQLHTILSGINGIPLPNGTQSGKFTRTAGRLNASDALVAATTDASPSHDGDIPGAVGIARRKSGRVNWPNDVNDIFKKRLRRGEIYRVTLSVPPGRDFDLYLWRPGTVEVWQRGKTARASAHGGSGRDEAFRFQASASKVHFIHVTSWFTDGRYMLRVRCTTC
jgi:subtilisin family serine protease